jgi:hypothetical protein
MKERIGAVVLDGNMSLAQAWRHLRGLTQHLLHKNNYEAHLLGSENDGVHVSIRKSHQPCRIGMVLGEEFVAAVNFGGTEVTLHYFVPLWSDMNTNVDAWWLRFDDPILDRIPGFADQGN